MAKASASIKAVETLLGHRFKDKALLARALSHPSLDPALSYQRLEFLGDRVLGLVIARWIYERFPNDPEGKLAPRFTGLVRRESLAEVARALDLGPFIRLAAGAAEEGAHEKDNVLADVAEALIGALYLDAGLEAVERFIHAHWAQMIEKGPGSRKDAKTLLQEWAQGRGLPTPSYQIVERTGPDHRPDFTVEVLVQGQDSIRGAGSSKREAEQKAAASLLRKLGVKNHG